MKISIRHGVPSTIEKNPHSNAQNVIFSTWPFGDPTAWRTQKIPSEVGMINRINTEIGFQIYNEGVNGEQ
jgi:hypothetical protein